MNAQSVARPAMWRNWRLAEQKSERVVCLDEGFAGNDQLKANIVQIFKTKGVTKFQTV
jgi:adenine-specific DNA-methyltransferase